MRFRIHFCFIFLLTFLCQAGPPSHEPFPESIELHDAIVKATAAPDSITLYVIAPGQATNRQKGSQGFHGFNYLAEKTISNPGNFSGLLTALRNGFQPVNFVTDCSFAPHHGVRLTKAGKSLDLLIGFSCALIEGHESGKTFGPFYINSSAMNELNHAYEAIGLPIPASGW